MTTKPDYQTIAARLIKANPLAIQINPDGSLIVIGPERSRHYFTADQIGKAQEKPSPVKKTVQKTVAKKQHK